jgi:hypothetical protein
MFYKIKKQKRTLDEKLDTLLTPEFFEYEKLEENFISKFGLDTKVYADDESLIKKARNFLLKALQSDKLDSVLKQKIENLVIKAYGVRH